MNKIIFFLLFYFTIYELWYLLIAIIYDNNNEQDFILKPLNQQEMDSELSSEDLNLSPPIILEWNGFSWRNTFEGNIHCSKKCFFTQNKTFENDATLITFHMGNVSLYLEDFPQTSNSERMNVFLNFEPPPHRSLYLNVSKDYFNLTATYRFDSDIATPYDCLKELGVNDKDKWDQNEVEKAIEAKNKSILYFVSHCKTDSKRELFVKNLKKYINVTQYGSCNKMECSNKQNCEKEEIRNHHFILALENSVCTDYLTEKVFRFRKLIVPIILNRDIIRFKHLSLNPYLIAASDFKSVKDLAEYLRKLMEDKEKYKKYFEWTKKYKKSRSCFFLLNDFSCKLCDIAWKVKLGYRKQIHDLHDWWGNNKCIANFSKSLPP